MGIHLGDNVPSVKRRNRALILELILRNGPIPRVTLSEITGLSRAAVSTITGELIDAEMIIETSEVSAEKRGVGRAPVFLDINDQLGGVIAIDVDSKRINGAFMNLKSRFEQRAERDINDPTDQSEVLGLANEVVDELILGAQTLSKRVLGIGVSISGLIDPFTGYLFSSSTLGWKDVNLVEAIGNRVEIPVVIDSNVRAMVLAEHLFGAGQGISNMALVYIGTGIGCGIILNDEVYAGSTNRAGELGHTITPGAEDRLCSCGKNGCLETVASGSAMARRVVESIKAGHPSVITDMVNGNLDKVTHRVIAEAAAQGDGLACEVISEAGEHLAMAVANLVNSFDPRLVVLAGSVTNVPHLVLDPIRSFVDERALGSVASPQITTSAFGPDVAVVGAGALALRELVYSPRFSVPGDVKNDAESDTSGLQQRLLRLTISRG